MARATLDAGHRPRFGLSQRTQSKLTLGRWRAASRSPLVVARLSVQDGLVRQVELGSNTGHDSACLTPWLYGTAMQCC